MGYPHGHRKTTTLVAGLRMTGMVALMVIDGPIKGDWFEAYVDQVLVPDLRRGDIVIMDNLSSHKRASVRDLIEAAAPASCFFHPTAPTSTPSKRRSPASKPCFAKPERAPSPACGLSSGGWSTCSSRRNAVTTSAPAAMTQTEGKPL